MSDELLSPVNPYRRYGSYLRRRFGCKVYKIPLHAGFTCPNLDGNLGRSGCTYCNNSTFNPGFVADLVDIDGQIRRGQGFLRRAFAVQRYIAYFQTFTNTYGPTEKLERLVQQSLRHPDMVGVAVGTRPDCVSPEALDFLDRLAEKTFVTIEYGLQSIHDRTLALLRRGHKLAAFEQAIDRSAGRRLQICVHVILGLPGESHGEMMATADYLRDLPIHSVKIHNLFFAKNTVLGRLFQAQKVRSISEDEYVETACDFIERLPGRMAIQRLCADAAPEQIYGPGWCSNKPHLLRRIRSLFEQRGTFQGARSGR